MNTIYGKLGGASAVGTTDRDLLAQALEALEQSRVFVTTREKIKHPEGTEWYDERITALRERLAQPEHDANDAAVKAERQRIVDLLMRQHEAAQGAHNYWHVAAQMIQEGT